MKNDQVFVDEIWKKYDNYKNTKHKEKFSKYININIPK